MRLTEIIDARLDSEARRARAEAERERLRQKRERERADQRKGAETQAKELAKKRGQIRERALRQGEKTRRRWERTSQQDRRRYSDWLEKLSVALGVPVFDPQFDASVCRSDQSPTHPAGRTPGAQGGPSLGPEATPTPRNIPTPPRCQGGPRKTPRNPSGKQA